MAPEDTAAALLASIDAEQQRLRELLSGKDEALLATRPPSGKWSVLENVRHLLFAEQLHLHHYLPGGRQWSALGLPPLGMQDQKQLRTAGVGSVAPSGVAEVLEAWQAAHQSTYELTEHDTPEVRKALARNLKHLRAHIKVVERLLRAPR